MAWFFVVGPWLGALGGLVLLATGHRQAALGILCLPLTVIGIGLLEGSYLAWLAVQWVSAAAALMSLLMAFFVAAPLGLISVLPGLFLFYTRSVPVRDYCTRNRDYDLFA